MSKFILLLLLTLSTNVFATIDGFNIKQNLKTDSANPNVTFDTSYLFEIDKKLLGKVLVWGTWVESSDSSIYPSHYTTGFSTISKLVYFKLSPDKKWVLMFEKDAQMELLMDNLVDRFPIKLLQDDLIVFDYSKGLPRKKLQTWMEISDPLIMKVNYSYVFNFVNKQEEITFAEVLKLEDKHQSTMVLRHNFRIYKKNNNFDKVELVRPWDLGFMPVDVSSTTKKLAVRKFDISKPIKFFLSSNIPKQYLPSIKEGILWWNEAFGKEVIILETLEKPVEWASARMNIFQWSDDPRFCTAGLAMGPSLADPITGEIYNAKVLFCGTSFEILYNAGFKPNTVDKEMYMKKLYKWAAAHEFGHAIGLAHNFYGKYYRSINQDVITSTVMDYPFPQDILKIEGLGARDFTQIDYLYLRSNSINVLEAMKKFPICTDDMVTTDLACTHFARGGMTPEQSIEWFLDEMAKEENKLVPADSKSAALFHKYLFLREDSSFIDKYKNSMNYFTSLIKGYDTFLPDLYTYASANKGSFLKLSGTYRDSVLSLLSDYITAWDLKISLDTRKKLIDVLKVLGDVKAFNALKSIESSLNSTYHEEAYRLKAYLKNEIDSFWN